MSINRNAPLPGKGECKNKLVNYNSFSAIDQLRQEMQARGFTPPNTIIDNGHIKRFGKNHSCWYVFHSDGIPAGAYGNWKTGENYKWRMNGNFSNNYHYKAEIEKAERQREVEQREKHKKASQKAQDIWNRSKPLTRQENHPYLIKKRIQPHGARLYGDALVIPIFNESDQLINLQFISPEGDKRFLSGGWKRGCFNIIGDLAQRILICEGFATGVSLYEDSRQRVIVAFDAGNLLPVAKNIRELSPDSEIIICCDNDVSGIGQAKARKAALDIGGKVLIPPVPGQDWNDYLTGGRNA